MDPDVAAAFMNSTAISSKCRYFVSLISMCHILLFLSFSKQGHRRQPSQGGHQAQEDPTGNLGGEGGGKSKAGSLGTEAGQNRVPHPALRRAGTEGAKQYSSGSHSQGHDSERAGRDGRKRQRHHPLIRELLDAGCGSESEQRSVRRPDRLLLSCSGKLIVNYLSPVCDTLILNFI